MADFIAAVEGGLDGFLGGAEETFDAAADQRNVVEEADDLLLEAVVEGIEAEAVEVLGEKQIASSPASMSQFSISTCSQPSRSIPSLLA